MADTPKTTLRAWLALSGAAVTLFCTVGFLNAFGVFQQYYSTFLPGRSSSDISWIGSLSIFLLYGISPFGGVIVDKIGPTLPLCVGSVGLVISLFMTSLCTQYWQLILAQAILLGISASLVFCPPLGVVMRHMPHRRGLAMGLTIGGSSIGGIIWPIMLQRLLNDDGVSFGWTIRAIAFTMIPLLSFACVTVREPIRQAPAPAPSPPTIANEAEIAVSAEKGDEPDRFAFVKTPTYILLVLGLALTYLGLFTPLFYISKYAIAQGLPTSTAFYLLSAVNASSFFGRVVPGHLADTVGHFNLIILFTLASGIVGFTWTEATTLAGIVIWSLAYGFTSGAVMALQGACAGKLAPLQAQGIAVGVLMGCLSLAHGEKPEYADKQSTIILSALVGTPISGQILSHSGYLALSAWTGATLVAGAAILSVARFLVNPKLAVAF